MKDICVQSINYKIIYQPQK